MEWIKATIKTTVPDIESITALLMDMGIFSVEINDPNEVDALINSATPQWDYIDEGLLESRKGNEAALIFYLGTDEESTSLLSQVSQKLDNIQGPKCLLTTESVNDQDWLHEWKKHFHPIRVGRVLIVPEWETPKSSEGDVVFTIDPGSAFGTGQHATTMLCIEALQEHIRPGCTILDIGCGSGILSIISLLLDAKKAIACDIDPSAVEVTRKNAVLNPISLSSIEAYTGDILTSPSLQSQIIKHSYDIIIANIVADVIIQLAPLLKSLELLTPGGVLIASGIITERTDEVLQALAASSFTTYEIKNSEGWCCVVANE